jgi:hypothetical protein
MLRIIKVAFLLSSLLVGVFFMSYPWTSEIGVKRTLNVQPWWVFFNKLNYDFRKQIWFHFGVKISKEDIEM